MARPGIQLDSRQEAAAESRENAVVTAGAGSGKTRVLSERYLRLVTDEHVPVNAILTLTFTRKAAAEMYERIYASLAAHRSDPFVAEQLGSFETAQISTVDSFCGQIARNGCTRFGVPTNFRVEEDEVDRLADDTALAFLLDNRNNHVLSRFIGINGFETVWRTGFADLAREYVLVSRRRNPADALTAQLAELGRLYRARLGELDAALATLRALDPVAGAIEKAQAAFAEVALDPDWDPRSATDPPAGLDVFDEAAKAVNKRTGKSTAGEVAVYKSCVDEIKRLRTEINTLVDTHRVREDLAELYRLVGVFEEQVRAEKRRRGLLSYRDVIELAVDLLRTDPTLRAYYAGRYRFIMIDEFQDNNELQKELLYLLALRPGADPPTDGRVGPADLDPRKLFFVGDEKQSIYRFRGADVSVFKSLATELTEGGGVSLELPFNYRSHPTLIAFFNSVFAAAMGGATASYEARFTPLEAPGAPGSEPPDAAPGASAAAPGASAAGGARVRIAWKPFEEDEGRTAAGGPGAGGELLHRDQAEAYYVARSIREAIDGGLWTARTPDGEQRPARFEDVAILMRSTSNQRHYERMLRLFGVPYSTQSVRSLFESAPAYDVYNWLQLCVHPEDRAAYASVLRSPLVNVSDDALSRLLLAGLPPFAGEHAEELAADDAAKYHAGAELYRDLAARVDDEPASCLVSDLWYRFGYRYRLLDSPALHPYLEYFDHLYELSRTLDDRPAVELVDALRENLGVYARRRELEVVREEQRGVQLLTIHKSKGLEFPVVVLANTGNMGRTSGLGTRPFYLSPRYGLTASMPAAGRPLADGTRVNYFFTEGERENAEMELAELKRLLYVALTRAESHLLVTGVFNSQNRDAEGHLLNQLLTALGITPDNPDAGGTATDVPVDIDIIPDVPRSATFSGAGRARGPGYERVLDHYRTAPRISRQAPPREISVSDLAARFEAAAAEGRAAAGQTAEGRTGGETDRDALSQELPAVESEELIESRGLAGFFGTLCHYLIEAAVGGRGGAAGGGAAGAPAVPELTHLPPGLRREALRREITVDEYQRIAADAAGLAAGFLGSDVTRGFALARVESEVPFVLHRRLGTAPVWITGQIDFVAEDAGTITVIDFKTDRTYLPRAHLLQLALYREAARELYGREVRAFVYYLRSGAMEEAGAMPDLDESLLAEPADQASKTR